MISNFFIKQEILNLLQNVHFRLTPISLERLVCKKYPQLTRKSVRSEVKALLTLGQLTYTQHFSTTHLEINYNQPFQVSDRIIISPPNLVCDSNRIVIKLNNGSSFGGGDHPTTRMSLRAIDNIVGKDSKQGCNRLQWALDIGTGSGVLAIAAAVLGVERIEGIDIDSVACCEAKANVKLNGFDNSVNISQLSTDDFSDHQFDLVIANLRPPTIHQLIPAMMRVSSLNSVWIISGCRKDEKSNLLKIIPLEMSDLIWQDEQNDWAAIALKRRISPV